VIDGLAELDAAGLAAAARVDLRLDHPGALAQRLGGGNRLVRGGGDLAGRDRDAVLGKQLFCLVFVEIHASPMGGVRPPGAGGRGPGTARGRAWRGRFCRRRGATVQNRAYRPAPAVPDSYTLGTAPAREPRLTQPSLIDRIEYLPRRELQAFGLYRVLEAALIAALALSPLRELAGPANLALAGFLAAAYLAAAFVLLALGRSQRPLSLVVLAGALTDIVAATLATHALPGVGAGIAMMLLFNVVAAAMLLRLRYGLAVAVLASLA